MMKTILFIIFSCLLLIGADSKSYGEVIPEGRSGISRLEGYMAGGDDNTAFLIRRGLMNTVLARKNVGNGKFGLQAEIEKPCFLLLSVPPKVSVAVWLLPGQSTSVSIDEKGVFFSGTGQEINNMLAGLDRKYALRYPGYSRNPVLDSNRSGLLCDIFWEQAVEVSSSGLTEAEKQVVIGYLQGELLSRLYSQVVMSKTFGKSFPKPEIGVGYARQALEIELLPEIVNHPQWLDGVQELLYDRLRVGKVEIKSLGGRITDMAMGLRNPGLQREYMLAVLENEVVQGILTGIGDRIAAIKPFLKQPEELWRLEESQSKIENKAQTSARALPGTDFSRFGFRNTEGDSVFFADFKGKYVFVDLWSTGCNPCVGEIPYIREMEERFAGQPLAWVSISMDLHEKVWKDFLLKQEMKGVQLICEKGFEHPFCEQIGLSGIPRFLLLDKEGHMLDCNSLRPSNPVLGELLNIQLKK